MTTTDCSNCGQPTPTRQIAWHVQVGTQLCDSCSPLVSPAGATRERAVPCRRCSRTTTWNIDAVCDRCI